MSIIIIEDEDGQAGYFLVEDTFQYKDGNIYFLLKAAEVSDDGVVSLLSEESILVTIEQDEYDVTVEPVTDESLIEEIEEFLTLRL